MGSIGDAYDNSMAESFLRTPQLELLGQHPVDDPPPARPGHLRVDRGLVQPSRRHSSIQQCIGEDDGHGWVAYGVAYPLGEPASVLADTLDALSQKVERGLAGMGLATSSGQTLDGRSVRRWVTGHRDNEPVLVRITDYASVWVEAESGCLAQLTGR